MGYTLQAVIGEVDDLKAHAGADVPVVCLKQGKALIPLNRAVRQKCGIPFLQFGHSPAALESLSVFVARFAKKVAYVEAEYFGGAGGQSAAVWESGVLTNEPTVDESAINQALHALGVEKQGAADEFDALDLGRYRDTDDWK